MSTDELVHTQLQSPLDSPRLIRRRSIGDRHRPTTNRRFSFDPQSTSDTKSGQFSKAISSSTLTLNRKISEEQEGWDNADNLGLQRSGSESILETRRVEDQRNINSRSGNGRFTSQLRNTLLRSRTLSDASLFHVSSTEMDENVCEKNRSIFICNTMV